MCLCNSFHVCVYYRRRVGVVNECPRDTTLGEEEVVGGQAEEKED